MGNLRIYMHQLIYNKWLCSFHSALCPVFISNLIFYWNVIKYKGFISIFFSNIVFAAYINESL